MFGSGGDMGVGVHSALCNYLGSRLAEVLPSSTVASIVTLDLAIAILTHEKGKGKPGEGCKVNV